MLWIVQKLNYTSASTEISTNVKIRILYKPEYVAQYAFTEDITFYKHGSVAYRWDQINTQHG